jgi:hypothetical protein
VASCSSGSTDYSFNVANPKYVSTYFWDVDGKTSTKRSFSYDYASNPGYNPGDPHNIILTLRGPGGRTDKFKTVVAPC